MSNPIDRQASPDFAWGDMAEHQTLGDEQILSGKLGGFKAATDLAACLLPLLQALGWEGYPRHISESLPHFADSLDLTDLLNVLAHHGYASQQFRAPLDGIDSRLYPCLYLPDHGMAQVALERRGRAVRVFDAASRSYHDQTKFKGSGTVYVFRAEELQEQAAKGSRTSFVFDLALRFRRLIVRALAASFFANLLVLATPIFIMGVYDRVVATGSLSTLSFMVIGVAVALLGDLALKSLRANLIAHIGARMDYLMGRAIFRRLLFLPPAYTEMANANAQVARLKDFESIREFFTGPLATVMLEGPFVLIFVAVMAMIGGTIAFVPLIALLIFVVMAGVFAPMLHRKVGDAAQAESRKQEFLVEALTKMRTLMDTGAEDIWYDRYRELSARAAIKGNQSALLSSHAAAIAQTLIMVAGLATLAWGVFKALEGEITVGGLIASMIMVWWILRPMQTLFLTLTQVDQIASSAKQINALMQLRPERDETAQVIPLEEMKGAVTLDRVSLRYKSESNPALIGVSLAAEPGEVVALVGPNGSGKSTMLKLIAGIYAPQAGTVSFDGIDIRQLDPIELRHHVAYVPQEYHMFFGTLAQNLRLSHPTATDEELSWACAQAGVLDEIEALPKGFWTRVGDGRSDMLPSNFLQRISLARAYLRRAPILLLDEPVNGLDFEGDRQFIKTLEAMRGSTTVFLVTHRPSHLRYVDKVAVLDGGMVRMFGPAEQVRKRIPDGLF
ncbi:peptidase domain-containing ABC transporter [Magnetospira sp. QH-2]|uniref:peptidase domain-containing ABC transporter n=1 Tax=Magnetospira sp. (strain QH-2) TaxID=1288970 RepID=UPI0003E813B3|nr:peptidase domain-containing ABC transporter [Magnetospira sp. QH-2]CCQ72474.1 ABC-type toxin translocation ATP-binding protein, hlyB family [Magnetospira sp. QH-2]